MSDIPEKPKTFGKWLENYWYHYKVHTLFAVLIIVGVVFGLYSCLSKEKIDITVYYICKDPVIYSEKTAALTQTIQHYATDYDGDGKVNVVINTLYVGEEYDESLVSENKSNFSTAYSGGGVMLIIADKYGADYVSQKQFFGDITDICPTAEYDGTVFNTKGSAFLQQDSMKNWGDEELYIGVRVYNEKSFINIQKDAAERFEYAKGILKNIVDNTQVS